MTSYEYAIVIMTDTYLHRIENHRQAIKWYQFRCP